MCAYVRVNDHYFHFSMNKKIKEFYNNYIFLK